MREGIAAGRVLQVWRGYRGHKYALSDMLNVLSDLPVGRMEDKGSQSPKYLGCYLDVDKFLLLPVVQISNAPRLFEHYVKHP